MKIATFAVAVTVAIPVVSSSAQSQPLTRAEVKAELIQLERAGYNPVSEHTTYPAGIQAAEGKLAAQNGHGEYGGVASTVSGSSRIGTRSEDGMKPIYFGQ